MQWVASYILFANIARNLNRGSDSFNWVENVQCCRYHLIDFYLTRVQSLSALVTQSLMLWCLHLWMYQLKLFYVVTVADVNAKERFWCLSFFIFLKEVTSVKDIKPRAQYAIDNVLRFPGGFDSKYLNVKLLYLVFRSYRIYMLVWHLDGTIQRFSAPGDEGVFYFVREVKRGGRGNWREIIWGGGQKIRSLGVHLVISYWTTAFFHTVSSFILLMSLLHFWSSKPCITLETLCTHCC